MTLELLLSKLSYLDNNVLINELRQSNNVNRVNSVLKIFLLANISRGNVQN